MDTMHDTRPEHAVDSQAQFADLLQRHRGIVLKVAHGYAWQAEDRADLAQEIAAQAWRAFARYDASRPFSTWLYRIALNVAISFVRENSQRIRHDVALDPELHDVADHTASPEREQQVQVLYRFIQRQAPLERALLLLYLDGHANRDIADVLGIGESNVGTKINRLKQRLRDEL